VTVSISDRYHESICVALNSKKNPGFIIPINKLFSTDREKRFSKSYMHHCIDKLLKYLYYVHLELHLHMKLDQVSGESHMQILIKYSKKRPFEVHSFF